MKQRRPLIMVGPDPDGRGGISRVVTLWRASNLFSENNVLYIASVSDDDTYFSKISCLIKGLLKLVHSLIYDFSMVYVHTASYSSFFRKSFFILIAISFRKKITLHIHPTEFYEFITGAVGLKRWYIFFLLNKINNFVVLTNEMKEKILSYIPDKPIYVLPNPINIEEMVPLKKYGRVKNRILYLGWYIKEKGIYDLVDAVEILVKKGVEARLEFYGTKEITALKEYVKKKNLTRQIKVNGWINGEKKLEVLNQSTMLILPSYSEGIPNVILEAMATKTPIVATHVGGLKEVLQDGENALIVEVKNPIDLSDKILRYLEDEKLGRRIATKAFSDAKTKYDIPVVKTKFKKIIEEVLI